MGNTPHISIQHFSHASFLVLHHRNSGDLQLTQQQSAIHSIYCDNLCAGEKDSGLKGTAAQPFPGLFHHRWPTYPTPSVRTANYLSHKFRYIYMCNKDCLTIRSLSVPPSLSFQKPDFWVMLAAGYKLKEATLNSIQTQNIDMCLHQGSTFQISD